MESGPPIFLFGQTKSGKTTMSHALSSSPLKITKEAYEFCIEAYENTDKEREIGNYAESKTIKPVNYCNDTICDFPGFEDTRGDEMNLMTLLSIYELIQDRENMRIAFCIEEGNIRTANASIFLRMSQKLVHLLELTKDDLPGICIVVTKSSAPFCQDMSRNFQRLFPKESNCIIEGIKNQSVTIKPFLLPVENGVSINFEKSNLDELKEAFNNIRGLNCSKMATKILPNILSILDVTYRNNPDSSGIAYLSNMNAASVSYTKFFSKNILCIDEDAFINCEQIIFEAPYVIVSTNLNRNEKRTIKIQGFNPVVSFLNVGKILNDCNLTISIQDSQKINFPDPTRSDFDTLPNFFRIESICINGMWTEYMTYNNIFLDLIAYINPIGRVLIDPRWKVSVATLDKRLKLFTNECMRTKDSIKSAFQSLKQFENVEQYLNACKGSNKNNSELKTMLEEHAVNIPSIFQLIMSRDLYRLDSKPDYLISVRDLLIERYLTLISEFIKKNNGITRSIVNLQALRYFLSEINHDVNSFNDSYKEIEQRLKIRLGQNVPDENLRNLFYFYDALSATEDKFELYECGLTGDISIYPNFQALMNLYNHSRAGDSSKSMLPGYVQKTIVRLGVALVSRVAVQRVAIKVAASAGAKAAAKMTARGAGKLAIKRASNQAAAGILKTATTISSFAGTAFFFAFELTANVLMANFKSGYLEGELSMMTLEID